MNKSIDYKNVLSILLISATQAINFIAILVFVPLLIKNYGLENYGKIVAIQAICLFGVIFTDYGFNVTAVRKLVEIKHDLKQVEIEILITSISKIILSLVFFPIYLLVSKLFIDIQLSWRFILLAYVFIVGQVCVPNWLYQGININKLGLLVNSSSKILVYFLLLYVIENQYELYLFSMGFTNLLLGLISYLIVYKKFHLQVRISDITFERIQKKYKEGWDVFVSNSTISLYLNSAPLLVAFFGNSTLVGQFGVIDRIISLVRSLQGVLVQALFPFSLNLLKEDVKKGLSNLIRLGVFLSASTLILSLFLFLQADTITLFFLKKDDPYIVQMIRFFSGIPFLISINSIPNIIIFKFNKERQKLYILLFSSFVFFLLSTILLTEFKLEGVGIAFYVTEFIIAFLTLILTRKTILSLHEE